MTQQKATAGRYKGFLLIFLVFGPAFFLIFISTRGCEHKFKVLDDYGKIPSYNFVDAKGKKYTNESFKNKIVLYTTIQETCPGNCAVSMWHLDQLIYQHLRKNTKKLGHVKIVSFVTDGKGNPVTDLSNMEYIMNDRVEEYDPNIWILASGESKKIYDITRNGENLTKQGKEYFGGEAYQELIMLVDKRNHLRMVLSGKQEGMIRTMKEDLALLDKQYDLEAYKKKHKK